MKIGFVEQPYEKLAVEQLVAVCEQAGAEVDLFVDPTLFSDAFYENNVLKRLFDVRQRLANQIVASDVDLLAFSVVTDDYLWATSIASLVKRQRDIPTVFGGIHPTAVPEYVAADPAVDYVCQGEGEGPLVELMDCLASGKKPVNVDNLCFYDGDRLIKNSLRKLEQDLDRLPFLHKELFYQQLPIMQKFYLTITNRYCPFRCTFCYNSGMRDLLADKGRYLRQRSPEHVIEELTLAKKYNYQYVIFNDDIFGFNRRWVRQFARLYKREISKPFFALIHPQYATKEIVGLLADAGWMTANMGIQSLDPGVRRQLFDRYESQDDIRNAIENIRRSKVYLKVDHIIGFPGDREEIEEAATEFYNEHRPHVIGCYWLRLYPGTKLTNMLIDRGEVSPDEIEKINSGEGESIWTGGSIKNIDEIGPFSILIHILPFVPRFVIRFLLKNKRYRIFRRFPHLLVMVMTRSAQASSHIKDIYGRWGLYLFVGRVRLYVLQRLRGGKPAPRARPELHQKKQPATRKSVPAASGYTPRLKTLLPSGKEIIQSIVTEPHHIEYNPNEKEIEVQPMKRADHSRR